MEKRLLKQYAVGVLLVFTALLGLTLLPPLISADDWLLFALGVVLFVCWIPFMWYLYTKLTKKRKKS